MSISTHALLTPEERSRLAAMPELGGGNLLATAMAVHEAHRRGLRVCSHARSGDSVKMSVRNGVDIIYHASFVDEEGLDMLEAKKDEIFVAPGLNWLVATLHDTPVQNRLHV